MITQGREYAAVEPEEGGPIKWVPVKWIKPDLSQINVSTGTEVVKEQTTSRGTCEEAQWIIGCGYFVVCIVPVIVNITLPKR